MPLLLILMSMRCCQIKLRADKLNLILTLAIPLVYFLIINVEDMYFIKESECFSMFLIYLAFYAVFFGLRNYS